MSKKLLDTQIDEAVAELILKKVDEFQQAVNESAEQRVSSIEEAFEAKKEELFAHVSKEIEDKLEEAKKEYSARLAAKLEEKNREIEELEEQAESYKEELSEKVNSFLTNSKEEVRSLVEEESRLSSEELKAQTVLEAIRDLVLDSETKTPSIESVDESKIARLEQDIEALKERVATKTKVNKNLQAKVRAFELVESVPSSDRDFYLEQMEGVETVNEADERFAKVKAAIKSAKAQNLQEELESSESRGTIVEEEEYDDEIVLEESVEDTNPWDERMKHLAGIK